MQLVESFSTECGFGITCARPPLCLVPQQKAAAMLVTKYAFGNDCFHLFRTRALGRKVGHKIFSWSFRWDRPRSQLCKIHMPQKSESSKRSSITDSRLD